MIEIIPAIDIINGKCVRLTGGDYSTTREYYSDPADAARYFCDLGYNRIHVVDLDGAASGKVINIETLVKICSIPGVIVDFGGGVKSDNDLEKVFAAGVSMVTAGSIAVTSPSTVERWLGKYGPERIILGADVKGSEIAIHGWQESSGYSLFNFLAYWLERGITRVISTQVYRDGTLQGPDISLYKSILERFPGISLVASGGVSNEGDLIELEAAGVKQVIVGKAIYEKQITLKRQEPRSVRQSLARRIIPCLDVSLGRVVKGINFVGLRDAGDPVELARRYSDEGADELVFLDITATHENRKTTTGMVRKVAETVNIPFTVGGGISTVEDVNIMLSNGADKVSVNSAAVRDPSLLNSLSSVFGSQCIVLAVDAAFRNGRWEVFLNGGRIPAGIELFDWVREATDRGAGEILFTSIDHDGARKGYALEALAQINSLVKVPVIASGGAGIPEHFRDAFMLGHADAALAAGLFHFGEMSVSSLKQYLSGEGITVR